MASTIAALTSGAGGISMTGDASGILNLNSNGTTVASVSSTGVAVTGTLSASNGISVANTFGFKNRIINGGMVIDQRNAGASVAFVASSSGYTVDRMQFSNITDGSWTAQRSTTTATGFTNSLLCTVTAADASLAATQFATIVQSIEGFNIGDLGWGTANAQTVTLSFWVRSSLTGTFGGSIVNSGQDRSYPFTYTINSANTFEQKAVTIAGDTSGTWLTNNGIGIRVYFGLGVGSTYSGTAGAWGSTLYLSATGATSVVGTNGATFYITGVQLEKGSTATSFDFRAYSTELAMCQRYYQKFSATAGGQVFSSGMMNATTTSRMFIPFLVSLRTNPTALEQSGTAGDYAIFHGSTVTTCSAVPAFVAATVNGGSFEATIASGGTTGNGALFRAVSSSAYLGWSAEL